ncbi:uncharacterized protein J3D65DRAFT_149952 [Phyllosticta citribraziliensis]|uniref:Uncharacterized protein n=1 Tax=Phyllosticta citribraziliensis TaxID=989973 RepID=A0ABR1L4R8_9PEZI
MVRGGGPAGEGAQARRVPAGEREDGGRDVANTRPRADARRRRCHAKAREPGQSERGYMYQLNAMSPSSFCLLSPSVLVSCAKATPEQSSRRFRAYGSTPPSTAGRHISHVGSSAGRGHGACGVGVTPQGQCHCSRSLLPTRPQLSSSSTPEPLVPPKYLQVTVAADAAPSLPHSPRSQHEGPTAPHSSRISCKSTVWTPSLASDAFSTWPGVAGLDAWLIRILPGRRGYPSSTRDRCFEHLARVLSSGCPLVLACTDV